MDPEQTFIRVQERFSQILNPRIRAFLKYTFLFVAITLFCILVVMHANYVQQPGCSSELTGIELSEAELLQIKITSAGLWSCNDESTAADVPQVEAAADNLEVSKTEQESCTSEENADNTFVKIDKEEPRSSFSLSAKETIRATILRFPKKCYRRISFVLQQTASVKRFFRQTTSSLREEAKSFLKSHQLDLDAAVSAFTEKNAGASSSNAREHGTRSSKRVRQ